MEGQGSSGVDLGMDMIWGVLLEGLSIDSWLCPRR